MNVRKRYNYEFLKELCKEYNITLLRDYSNENLHRDYKTPILKIFKSSI